ncbi:MAG: glycosyltransferase family 4 protein [Candidatus Thermoplasmatota archaeon]|nr:glycosyltransferase family 4 protein [Candidatus Thermoplasmatota archaeon]
MEKNDVLEHSFNRGTSKMKIAHFSWEFPPAIWGGLGTFATEITQKQASLGNEVTVFAVNNENKLNTLDRWNGVEVYRPKTLDLASSFYLFSNQDLRSWGLNFNFFADVIGYNVMSASKLVDLLVRKNGRSFDIIEGHDWLGIFGGIIAKKELDIPLMFHVHSTEVGRSGGGGSTTIKNIEFEGAQAADCVITVSYSMKDELKKLGFPEDKIRVCWNGIDPDKYVPQKISHDEKIQLRRRYGVADDEHLLFFIGRLVTIKGVENLVKAMPSVFEDFPNTKLVILGVGDLEEDIRSLANSLNIGEKIVLRTEFVSEQERILHYAAADSVVLPSLYEPFGIVCTEAMSMAKPVVVGARGTSGMREQIIPDGENQCGVHMNPYDPNDIAWGIKQVLESKEKSMQMGINARKRVIEQFSWDAVANRTLDIYKEFVKR